MAALQLVPQIVDVESAVPQPERTLIVEVLRQAVRDIIDVTKGKSCGNVNYSRSAQEWINSDSTNTINGTRFTFLGICEELNLDPGQIRKEIETHVTDRDFQARFEQRHRGSAAPPHKMVRRGPLRYSKISMLASGPSESLTSEASEARTSDQPVSESTPCAEETSPAQTLHRANCKHQ